QPGRTGVERADQPRRARFQLVGPLALPIGRYGRDSSPVVPQAVRRDPDLDTCVSDRDAVSADQPVDLGRAAVQHAVLGASDHLDVATDIDLAPAVMTDVDALARAPMVPGDDDLDRALVPADLHGHAMTVVTGMGDPIA